MHIKSIVLDGFKSYGVRTEIDGFDNLFNAITGLNGSGKSNILDAICFVLGLSKMELARCTNLRELIYKNGQANVTKAIVTITFDNKDKNQSPIGFQQYDEIVIRREVNVNSRSKYWINGFSANNQQVSDLFHSVSLNIHNPHFLIMQGRITKVLNMKPNEILSMVEEATGVSMYEAKKKSTQTMIEKKDSALRVIDALINETIVPKLDQLKKEQTGLIEFQRISAEVEALTKVLIAYQFMKHNETTQKASAKIDDKNNEINDNQRLIEQTEEEAKCIEDNIRSIERKKDEELGGKLNQLEEQLKTEQLSEAKQMGELNLAVEELKDKEKKELQLSKNLESDRKITTSKEKQLNSCNEKLEKLKADAQEKEEKLKKAEKDFEDISAGKSRAQEGEAAATLADQLMTAEKEVSTASVDFKKAEMKIKHMKNDLIKKEKEVNNVKNTYDKDMKEINSRNSEVNKLKANLNSIGFDENKHSELKTQINQLKHQIDGLSNELTNSESRINGLRLEYKDPHPNFNRDNVIGVACNLFSINNMDYSLAVEKAAGNKLFNVVVRDSQTAKAILERGQLRDRKTFIPLDRIRGINIDPKVLKKAQDLVGRDNVNYAINYINYDQSLHETMKYIFGDTLIVPNMEVAKRVCYAPGVKKVTVTYDGEVFDPSGTLSGGSVAHGTQLLTKIAEINNKKRTIEEMKNNYYESEREFREIDKNLKKYTELKQNYELKALEADLIQKRLQQGSSAHIIMQEIEELKTNLINEQQILKDSEDIMKNSTKRVNDLKLKLKDSKSIREREHKESEQNLKIARNLAEKAHKLLTEDQQKVELFQMEIEDLSKQMNSYEQQLNQYNTEIEDKRSEVEVLQQRVNDVKQRVETNSSQLKEHKRKLKSHSDEISKMQKQRETVLKRAQECQLKIKEIQFDIQKINKDSKESAQTVKHMIKKYQWIDEEKHLFGDESAGYGFNHFNHNESNRRLERLKSEKSSMAKTVNMRANIMLSDKEKESLELSRRREIVSTDKSKLIKYMQEVDQKKKDALLEAHKKINIDFESIFSTFLPNSVAQLVAPDGKAVTDGLEVKVAFGNVWKESLTELSGGQRSLVALSLILALLKFNPAPLYILDEVDAALDQSHTQNTGIMIRKHFRNSQFVIVSLKDDMFNNANVLFKTKFVDGMSHVTRLTRNK
ncbi:structural maintenance of chromosomes protein 2-like [Oppia nitens]|uniref:structural maintenance of chromosomes protein 2-like n=1 Tax=Oppia nitens TaxID=1686743 RepID=UPI0023DBD10C|nr:structural maintenance of chromosomes protein 2-like [Oppia nitens]